MDQYLFTANYFENSGQYMNKCEKVLTTSSLGHTVVMPKYWGKQIFIHGRFPEVGQKQKTERKRREKEKRRKTERW